MGYRNKVGPAGIRNLLGIVTTVQCAAGVAPVIKVCSHNVEEAEMERGLKIMVDEAAGRVPVYFGIGAISTRPTVRQLSACCSPCS